MISCLKTKGKIYLSLIIDNNVKSKIKPHQSYVILSLVPSTVIFWTNLAADTKATQTRLCCPWLKSYLQKWFTITKYPFCNWQWISSFLHRFCLSSFTNKTFTELDNWVTWLVFYKKQDLFNHSWATGFTPSFLVWSVLFIFKVLCVV
jgi:hypothetical protein